MSASAKNCGLSSSDTKPANVTTSPSPCRATASSASVEQRATPANAYVDAERAPRAPAATVQQAARAPPCAQRAAQGTPRPVCRQRPANGSRRVHCRLERRDIDASTGITTLSIPSDSRANTAAGSESAANASNLRRLRRSKSPRPRVARALKRRVRQDHERRHDAHRPRLQLARLLHHAARKKRRVRRLHVDHVEHLALEQRPDCRSRSRQRRLQRVAVERHRRIASERVHVRIGGLRNRADDVHLVPYSSQVRLKRPHILLHAVGPIDAVIQHQRHLQNYLPCAYVCSPWNTKFTSGEVDDQRAKADERQIRDLRPAQPCVVRACRYAA